MTNSKSTKRALVSSVLALLLCVAMLVGATFAWFTDTASTGVNKIQSGTLKVDIVGSNGASLDGKKLSFKDVNGNTDILWEPGATFNLDSFRIVNEGNLALKYKVIINGVDGDNDLLKAIDFTVKTGDGDATPLEGWEGILLPAGKIATAGTNEEVGQTDLITISGTMKKEAGNEFQGLSIDGIGITVVATQYTYENDSNDNQYDKDAAYPVVVSANTVAEYNAALATVAANSQKNQTVSIKLTGEGSTVTGAKAIQTANSNKLAVDLNEKTIVIGESAGSTSTETNGAQFLQGTTVLLENGTYKFADENPYKQILIQNYSNLTLNNVTLDASDVSYALSTNCGKVTIKGNTNIVVKSGGTALDIMHWENASYKAEGSHVVIDETMTGTIDGKIDVYCYGSSVRPVDDGGATLTIMGGTFKNSGLTLEQFQAFVPTGYTVTTNTDGSFTVTH